MDVDLNIARFDPESDEKKPYRQEFNIEVDETSTVLDGLIKIREEVDGTLGLRCSCRSAICGSCAMRVNGQAVLACNTKIADLVSDKNKSIDVEPIGNMKLIKDLIVEFDIHWEKIKAIDPWVKTDSPPPAAEYIASNESMVELAGVMGCIQCGACVSDCTVLAVDETFLGPAALAKAYRFIADPRDDANDQRLKDLNEPSGMWDCTRCLQCVEVCPKGVDPMGRIMKLRDFAMEAGYKNTTGARHAEVFAEIIRNNGVLNEFWLPVKTFGMFNIPEMLKLAPIGLKAMMRGKMPPIFYEKIPGSKNITKLFEKTKVL